MDRPVLWCRPLPPFSLSERPRTLSLQIICTGALFAILVSSFICSVECEFNSTCTFCFRYIKVELEDPTYGARYREVFRAMKDKLSKAPFDEACQPSDTNQSRNGKSTKSNKGTAFKSIVDSVSKLASSRKHLENAGEGATSEHTKRGRKTIWDILIAQDRFIARIIDDSIEEQAC